MELLVNGQHVTITPMPVTLRNAATCQEWAVKMREHVLHTNRKAQQALFVELMQKHPELMSVMSMDGGINPQAVLDFIERDRKGIERKNANLEEGEEPIVFNEEQSRKDAIAWVQKTIADMMKDTPSMTKLMQYTMPTYGTDLASLRLGIDCIIATYDRKPHGELNEAIANRDGDHWLDVSAVEVADYVNNFLTSVAE